MNKIIQITKKMMIWLQALALRQWQKVRAMPWYQLLFRAIGSLFLVIFIPLMLCWILVQWEWIDRLPAYEELRTIQNSTASEVYAIDGTLLGKYFVENRTTVAYEDLSPFLTQALVATEDARFYEHKGVDTRAWLRVFFRTILMQDESGGGGSTITQQLAKNLFPRKRYWFFSILINKMREISIARRLERLYSKEELLTLYFNTVPFGGNIYGVEVACRQFFNTSPSAISVEEAAVLVGMLKATTYYNPLRHPERSEQRRNIVLQLMSRKDYLSTAQADSLKQLPLKLDYQPEGHNEGSATYFRAFLRARLEDELSQLEKPDGSSYNLYRDGLKIYTTIDPVLQAYAEESVSQHLSELQSLLEKHWKGRKLPDDRVLNRLLQDHPRVQQYRKKGYSGEIIDSLVREPYPMEVFSWDGIVQDTMSLADSLAYYYRILSAGFLAMEHRTGRIKAWVGGINHRYFQYDHVLSRRQAGSTFKPIVYAAALEQGISPCEYIPNNLVTYSEYEDWQPRNADGKYGGVYSMEGGLSQSVNAIAVDLIMRTGVGKVQALAQAMGITNEVPSVPSIALGTAEVSLLDMVQVYATIANEGKRVQPVYLLRIENRDGEVIKEYPSFSVKDLVLGKEESLMLRAMLQSVVDSGTARRLRYIHGLSGDIAGKTGTTNSHADGWFVGFIPGLVAGTWVGGEYPAVRFRSLSLGQGASTALPVWGKFMEKVYRNKSYRDWTRAAFPLLPYPLRDSLDCPPFYEEGPPEEESDKDVLDELIDFFRFRKKKEKEDRLNERPRGGIRIFPGNPEKREERRRKNQQNGR
jgi:penicillin-binding protein 1A